MNEDTLASMVQTIYEYDVNILQPQLRTIDLPSHLVDQLQTSMDQGGLEIFLLRFPDKEDQGAALLGEWSALQFLTDGYICGVIQGEDVLTAIMSMANFVTTHARIFYPLYIPGFEDTLTSIESWFDDEEGGE